jgi:N-acyl-D-amino-acid deacylase
MVEYVSPETITEDWAAHNLFASCPPYPAYHGRNVGEVAAAEGLGLDELLRQVFATPAGRQTISIGFGMSEEDLVSNIRHPLAMIGSDGIPDLSGLPHPRLFGTFPRVFAQYVRGRGVISVAEAVRRMTSLPADRFGLAGRGRVAAGAVADLVIFDPATITDVATYQDPKREPAGVHWVVVNGTLAYEHGRHTGARPGQLLYFSPLASGRS